MGPNFFELTFSNQKILTSSLKNSIFNGTNNSDNLVGGLDNDVLYGNGGDDYLYGGYGNDEIYGGDGADYLYGESGGDSLIPGKGNDIIDGGSGADGVWFSGDFNDYTIRGTSNNLTISDNRSGDNDGTNTLKNIELLNFKDKKNLSVNLLDLNSHKILSNKSIYNEGESIIIDIISDRKGAFFYFSSGSNIDNNDVKDGSIWLNEGNNKISLPILNDYKIEGTEKLDLKFYTSLAKTPKC